MRYKRFIAMCVCLISLWLCQPVAALDTVPSDDVVIKTDSPLLITNYSVTGSRLNYVQIYNNSDVVQQLDGWKASFTIGSTSLELPVELAGLVAPKKYIIIADQALGLGSPFEYATSPPDGVTKIAILNLHPPEQLPFLTHTAAVPSAASDHLVTYYVQRNISTATGNYLTSFTTSTIPPGSLFMDPLYDYPSNFQIQFTEILAHPSPCAPNASDVVCQDYVKLFNPTTEPIDLAGVRLRNGYQGQTPSSSNTTMLQGSIQPGQYVVYPVNVTNSGGWLWFEDVYGFYRYDETITEYPDASATSKEGQAWAYDESDGIWKWTTILTPFDQPSRFPEPIPPTPVSTALTPCKENQYRSEETNRCRTIVSESELTACKEGQYRSEETNRCRSVVSAVAALVPCREGQERNPETNRCRSIASLASSLTPCKEGQERNPATNRCRNVTSTIPEAAFAVEPVKDTGKAFIGWWALGGVGLFALGYAGWEWRREMASGFRRIVAAASRQR